MTEFLAFWVTRRRGDAAPESWLGGSSTIYFTNVRVALAFLRCADNAGKTASGSEWSTFSVDNGIHVVVEIQQTKLRIWPCLLHLTMSTGRRRHATDDCALMDLKQYRMRTVHLTDSVVDVESLERDADAHVTRVSCAVCPVSRDPCAPRCHVERVHESSNCSIHRLSSHVR
jgi:hypothetical protein